jgi:hypothetical protein
MKLSKLARAKFRVKIRSLTEEARIIRQEERRCIGQERASDRGVLRGHRVGIVREEQRATLLAYAFVRGVPYRAVEWTAKPLDEAVIGRIMRIINSLAWSYKPSLDVLRSWTLPSEEKAA